MYRPSSEGPPACFAYGFPSCVLSHLLNARTLVRKCSALCKMSPSPATTGAPASARASLLLTVTKGCSRSTATSAASLDAWSPPSSAAASTCSAGRSACSHGSSSDGVVVGMSSAFHQQPNNDGNSKLRIVTW